MFKEMAAAANLLKNAPLIASEASAMKQRLSSMRIVGDHAGVSVVVSGDHQVVQVSISEAVHSAVGRETLEQSLAEACNVAPRQARDAGGKEMKGMARGLGIGGIAETLLSLGGRR